MTRKPTEQEQKEIKAALNDMAALHPGIPQQKRNRHANYVGRLCLGEQSAQEILRRLLKTFNEFDFPELKINTSPSSVLGEAWRLRIKSDGTLDDLNHTGVEKKLSQWHNSADVPFAKPRAILAFGHSKNKVGDTGNVCLRITPATDLALSTVVTGFARASGNPIREKLVFPIATFSLSTEQYPILHTETLLNPMGGNELSLAFYGTLTQMRQRPQEL